jgi:hypothetical protein
MPLEFAAEEVPNRYDERRISSPLAALLLASTNTLADFRQKFVQPFCVNWLCKTVIEAGLLGLLTIFGPAETCQCDDEGAVAVVVDTRLGWSSEIICWPMLSGSCGRTIKSE